MNLSYSCLAANWRPLVTPSLSGQQTRSTASCSEHSPPPSINYIKLTSQIFTKLESSLNISDLFSQMTTIL